jgi:hypothetical protein
VVHTGSLNRTDYIFFLKHVAVPSLRLLDNISRVIEFKQDHFVHTSHVSKNGCHSRPMSELTDWPL